MKRILVTGSNGLLGQKITASHLADPKQQLLATSRGNNRFPASDHYRYEALDFCDEAALRRVIGAFDPEVIIHTAAVTNADHCAADPVSCKAANIDGVRLLASVCQERDIHLIFLSTDFVFDGTSGPYSEADDPAPLSIYGESKLEGEKIVAQLPGKWTIIRTVLVYGVLKDMSRSNIVLWVKNSLERGVPIRVVNDQWRTPTLAEDLANACLTIADEALCGLYHISGAEYLRVSDIARQVARYWNLDESLISEVPSSELPQAAERPLQTGFVIDKAAATFKYRPHTLKEGLAVIREQLQAVHNTIST